MANASVDLGSVASVIAGALLPRVVMIRREARFAEDLGCDELDAMEIIAAAEAEFGVTIDDASFARLYGGGAPNRGRSDRVSGARSWACDHLRA